MSWWTNYKNSIFALFGAYDKQTDINVDVDGKGTYERYNEVVGDDIDNNVVIYIQNMFEENHLPATLQPIFFTTVEASIGIDFILMNAEAWRRRIIMYIKKLCMIKGTKRCITLMLSWFGLSVVITETFAAYGLDSPVTFDDVTRRFDMRCYGCSYFQLAITGAGPLAPEVETAIGVIVAFNKPINATYLGFTYTDSTAGDFIGGDFDGGDFLT